MTRVRVYTTKTCPYCKTLKDMLTENNVDFVDVDVSDERNNKEFEMVIKITDSDMVPIIKVDKNLLVPEKSFKSIPQAVEMIKTIINGK